jgi:hypothetical protein
MARQVAPLEADQRLALLPVQILICPCSELVFVKGEMLAKLLRLGVI